MSHLNSNLIIHTPFGSPKRFIKDTFYHPIDDDSKLDDMSSFDSRRSSLSSFSSISSSPRLGGHEKLNRRSTKLDCLENPALKEDTKNKGGLKIEDYQSVFKIMSNQIDQFLAMRNSPENVISLLNQENPDDLLDDWIQEEEQPKEEPKNVERLINALQHLSVTYSTLKKQAKKQEKKINQLTTASDDHKETISILKEENTELEQLVDNLRREMETMLEEVEQIKQDRDLYARKANTLENDLQIISNTSKSRSTDAMQSQLNVCQKQINELEQTHREEQRYIEKLRSENRQLTDENYALKRDISRLTSKHQSEMAVLGFEKMGLTKKMDQLEKKLLIKEEERNNEKAIKQQNTDLEIALRRTVAERDGQIAKLNVLLERKQREMEQTSVNQEKKIRLEISTRENELKQELSRVYQKEYDIFKLNLARENRALQFKITDLEFELEGTSRLEATLQRSMLNEENLHKQINQFKNQESELKTCIWNLEQKTMIMEQETLHLYSRNLELTHQLGDLDL